MDALTGMPLQIWLLVSGTVIVAALPLFCIVHVWSSRRVTARDARLAWTLALVFLGPLAAAAYLLLGARWALVGPRSNEVTS